MDTHREVLNGISFNCLSIGLFSVGFAKSLVDRLDVRISNKGHCQIFIVLMAVSIVVVSRLLQGQIQAI